MAGLGDDAFKVLYEAYVFYFITGLDKLEFGLHLGFLGTFIT